MGAGDDNYAALQDRIAVQDNTARDEKTYDAEKDNQYDPESGATHSVPIAITFCYRRGRTRIHKSVISALQNPAYIRLLIHPKKKVVIIQACNDTEREAIKVPVRLFSGRSEFMINSIALLESIHKLMGWSEQLTYRVKGKLLDESGMVVFLLETAVVVREKEE